MALTKQQIETRIAELDVFIAPLMSERTYLKQQLVELKSEFAVGDIIRWQHGMKFRRGRVLQIRNWVLGDPMWIVRNIRSDGTEGEIVEIRSYQNPLLDQQN